LKVEQFQLFAETSEDYSVRDARRVRSPKSCTVQLGEDFSDRFGFGDESCQPVGTAHNFHLNARDNPPATTAISEHAVKKTTVKPFVNLNGTKATRERWAAAAQRMVVRSLLAVAK
jgi:hypothetical protein